MNKTVEVTLYLVRDVPREASHRVLYDTAEDYVGHPFCAALSAEQAGKPYFTALPRLFFSISHSGAYWVCAYAGEPVGIDLQEHRPLSRAGRIAERCFHGREREYLASGGSFYDVWAAKESYVKYTGEGITASFASFATAGREGLYPAVYFEPARQGTAAALRHVDVLPGYSFCVCTEKTCTIRVKSLT